MGNELTEAAINAAKQSILAQRADGKGVGEVIVPPQIHAWRGGVPVLMVWAHGDVSDIGGAMTVAASGAGADHLVLLMDNLRSRMKHTSDGKEIGPGDLERMRKEGHPDAKYIVDALMAFCVDRDLNVTTSTLPYTFVGDTDVAWGDLDDEEYGGFIIDLMKKVMEQPSFEDVMRMVGKSYSDYVHNGGYMTEEESRARVLALAVQTLKEHGHEAAIGTTNPELAEVIKDQLGDDYRVEFQHREL